MKQYRTPLLEAGGLRAPGALQPLIFTVVALFLLSSGALFASTNEGGQPGTGQTGEQAENVQTEGDKPRAQTDPEDGAELTRPARSLRVWFDRPPVVAESELTLAGPKGPLLVQGLHTMGEDDLMARVVGAMPNGTYEASYTVKFSDGETQSGSWSFSVQRPVQANH